MPPGSDPVAPTPGNGTLPRNKPAGQRPRQGPSGTPQRSTTPTLRLLHRGRYSIATGLSRRSYKYLSLIVLGGLNKFTLRLDVLTCFSAISGVGTIPVTGQNPKLMAESSTMRFPFRRNTASVPIP